MTKETEKLYQYAWLKYPHLRPALLQVRLAYENRRPAPTESV